MKFIPTCIGLLALLATASCELDNYDPPMATLSGSVVYEGQPLGLRNGGVQLELWQPGYALNTKIPVHIDQDGSFKASLFDGTYKLTFVAGNGPWVVSTDTILVELTGAKTIDVPVQPYYTIHDETVSAGNNQVNSSFRINQVSDSRSLQWVGLYIGTTAILDNINHKQRVELQADDLIDAFGTPIDITAELTGELAGRSYVFARIGVKTSGVNEMLFSEVFKLTR